MSNERKMIDYSDIDNDGNLEKDGKAITVLTYNILAPHLSTKNWENRKKKLFDELEFYKADIMCLQEVMDNDVTEYFGPKLLEYGYEFRISTEKKEANDDSEKKFQMGCAIFYKISRFRVNKEYKIDFCDAAERFLKEYDLNEHKEALEKVGIGCVLEFLPEKRKLMVCIVNVHLSADKDLADVKLLQAFLLRKGLSVIHEAKIPIIVAGDFNILPKSEPYMMIMHGHMPKPVKDNTEAKDQTALKYETVVKYVTEATDETAAKDATAVSDETAKTDQTAGKHQTAATDKKPAASLESAYSTILKSGSRQARKECKRMNIKTMEPIFTTVSDNFKNTIDYIFYTKEDFTVERILELIDDVEELPSEVWPSDHIALMVYLKVKKNRKMDASLKIPEYPWGDPKPKQKENAASTSRDADDREFENAASTSRDADDREFENAASTSRDVDDREFETSNSKEAADQECETSSGKETGNEECETSASSKAYPHCCRKMIDYHGNDGKDENAITILTYNVLAPNFMPPENWEGRKSKLLEELKYYTADVMCLQEVLDTDVTGYFGPQLREHGYDYIMNTETDGMIYLGKKTKMGCAIFYKSSSFRVKKKHPYGPYKINFRRAAHQFLRKHGLEKHDNASRYLKDKPGIGCMLEFLPKEKKIMIFIATVHLTAPGHLPDVKSLQTYLLLKGLSVIEEANIPIIVAGDFNITPQSEPYMMITDRQKPKTATDEKVGINLCKHMDVPMAAALESAYSTILRPGNREELNECKGMNRETMEPIFTTASKTPYIFKNTIDYIFYTKEEFIVEGILELIDDVEELPTEVWPSDHIALMANIQLKQNREMDEELAKLLRQPVADIWNKRNEGSPCSSEEATDQECETSSGKESVNKECETSTSTEAYHKE